MTHCCLIIEILLTRNIMIGLPYCEPLAADLLPQLVEWLVALLFFTHRPLISGEIEAVGVSRLESEA